MLKSSTVKATLAMLVLAGLAACETTEGFGRDVQNTGAAITQEAQEAQ